MASQPGTSTTDLVSAERTLETRGDALVSTVTVETTADVPLVVRFADEVGDWSSADSVRVPSETEPERWTVEGATLVVELLVGPDAPTTVTYELRGADGREDPTPVVVERVQPTDREALETGRVPRFRDTQTFEGRAPDASLPAGEGEATDEDVREAIEAVSESRSEPVDGFLASRPDPIDLADPADPEESDEPSRRP